MCRSLLSRLFKKLVRISREQHHRKARIFDKHRPAVQAESVAEILIPLPTVGLKLGEDPRGTKECAQADQSDEKPNSRSRGKKRV
jgi:hypothetical protein